MVSLLSKLMELPLRRMGGDKAGISLSSWSKIMPCFCLLLTVRVPSTYVKKYLSDRPPDPRMGYSPIGVGEEIDPSVTLRVKLMFRSNSDSLSSPTKPIKS